MMRRKDNSIRVKRLALSALMSTISVLFLYIGSIIEVLDLSLATLASFICVFVVIEIGGGCAYLVYATTGAISILFLPNKFIAVTYILFAGIYPIIKRYFERLPRIPQWILKILLFNIEYTAIHFSLKFIFLLEETGLALDIISYALFNLFFILYDIALTRLISYYYRNLRKRLRIDKIFK